MGYGGLSGGFPFEYGGGPTETETIYQALRNAVGVGGSAANDEGIDGVARQCKAMALAAGFSAVERAVMQAFPQVATDHIPLFEEEYGIVPPEGATDQDRRLAIAEAYTAKALQSEVDLAVRLAAIDTRLAPVVIPRAKVAYVQLGKAFEPQDGSPTYGGLRKSTAVPNYSMDFYVPVQLTLAVGPMPTPVDVTSITRAKRLLREALPAWVDFAVITDLGPLVADVSPLDLTCTT